MSAGPTYLKKLGVLACVLAAALACAAPAGAATSLTLVEGNTRCADLDPNLRSVKFDLSQAVRRIGSQSVFVTGQSFSWQSTVGIDAVIVKGGPRSHVYRYTPEATADTGLTAPFHHGKLGRFFNLGHVEFCWDR